MAAVKYLVVLLAIFITADSRSIKAGDRKCVPMQWESVLLGIVAQDNQGKSHLYDVVGTIHYDYKIGIEALKEDVYSDNKLIASYKIIASQNASYLADVVRTRCTKLPGAPIDVVCTDTPGLTYVGSWTLGSQMTDTYRAESAGVALSYLTMFRDPFIPGTQNIQQSIGGVSQLTTVQFANVTEGIKDPSVFDLPDYCSSSMLVPMDKIDSQFIKGTLVGMK